MRNVTPFMSSLFFAKLEANFSAFSFSFFEDGVLEFLSLQWSVNNISEKLRLISQLS